MIHLPTYLTIIPIPLSLNNTIYHTNLSFNQTINRFTQYDHSHKIIIYSYKSIESSYALATEC